MGIKNAEATMLSAVNPASVVIGHREYREKIGGSKGRGGKIYDFGVDFACLSMLLPLRKKMETTVMMVGAPNGGLFPFNLLLGHTSS